VGSSAEGSNRAFGVAPTSPSGGASFRLECSAAEPVVRISLSWLSSRTRRKRLRVFDDKGRPLALRDFAPVPGPEAKRRTRVRYRKLNQPAASMGQSLPCSSECTGPPAYQPGRQYPWGAGRRGLILGMRHRFVKWVFSLHCSHP
jgi:hypothetical protein